LKKAETCIYYSTDQNVTVSIHAVTAIQFITIAIYMQKDQLEKLAQGHVRSVNTLLW